MADRGFDISNILPDGVTINIPPFKGSRSQLTAPETEEKIPHINSTQSLYTR